MIIVEFQGKRQQKEKESVVDGKQVHYFRK